MQHKLHMPAGAKCQFVGISAQSGGTAQLLRPANPSDQGEESRCVSPLPASAQECLDWCISDPNCLGVVWAASDCYIRHWTEEIVLVPTASHYVYVRGSRVLTWLTDVVFANSSEFERSAGGVCSERNEVVAPGPGAGWCHEYTQTECGLWCLGDANCQAVQWRGGGVFPVLLCSGAYGAVAPQETANAIEILRERRGWTPNSVNSIHPSVGPHVQDDPQTLYPFSGA